MCMDYETLIYSGVPYPNFEINSKGNVRNRTTGTIYKNRKHASGYIVTSLPLGHRGKVKIIRIHKALAETFSGDAHYGKVVNHIDEDKANYSLDNLEWVTHKENSLKHWERERFTNPYANNRVFSCDVVRFIQDLYSTGAFSLRCLSEYFQVSRPTMSYLIRHITYQECDECKLI